MSKINNKTIYPFDVNITDQDYVIGSDGDNLGKITRNYNIGDLRRYINSGLSQEVGGTLKVSEITYNGVLTSPSEVANALDPNYQVLQYHIVIFSVNGNKYILKEQDITLGLSGTTITDEDFILIIGFTKLGDGTNVLKGYNTSTGLHEFYSIKKDGNLLNLTESLGNIVLSIDETELSEFIKENGKTYSVANVGTGVEVYKDSTIVGDNTQFNFRTVVQENQGTGKSFLRDIEQTTDELKVRVKTLTSTDNTVVITTSENEINIESSIAITAGTNVSVSGNGTTADPYIINSDTQSTQPSLVDGITTIVNGDGITVPYSTEITNLQKEITASYVLQATDNNYTVIINNGTTPISITINNTLPSNGIIYFIQQGTGDVNFNVSGVTINSPGSMTKIKGQNYWACLTKVGSSTVYQLLGSLKA